MIWDKITLSRFAVLMSMSTLWTQGFAQGHAAIQAQNQVAAPASIQTEGPTTIGNPRVLTLDESIQIAIKEASAVLKAESDTEVRAEQLVQGYLQFLPSLIVQGGYNKFRGRNFLATAAPTLVRGSSSGTNYQVSTTLNIFNGLGDISAYKSIRNKKSAADKTFDRAKQQIALDVAQSFLQVILDAKVLQIAKDNLKTSQDRERLLDAQSKVGTRSLADLFRQQAQTSADQSSLISTQNRFESDKILLLRRLRLDPRSNIAFQEPIFNNDIVTLRQANSSPLSSDALTQEALNNRPDLDASQKLAAASREDVKFAQAPFLPRLDFVATYGSLTRDFDFQRVNGVDVTPTNQDSVGKQLADHTNATYGLAVTWNVFDRWVTRSNVAVARGIAYRSKIDAEDYRNQVIGEVRQVVVDRNASVQQLVTSQVGLTAAQKAFEVTEGRFSVGALSFVDLSAAQTALFQAQTSFAQALIGYELQKRALAYVLGTGV
ncbi:MAG: TolC family protein [Chitinophagaceae bacterium]|nr:TolC family protein [Oligoflexus sp.]